MDEREFDGAHTLMSEQVIPLPREQVFEFFSNPRNLQRITPPWLSFKVVEAPEGDLRSGSLICYRLKLHGVPSGWTTRIERWTPGECFVDTQLRGPYKLWHHTHEFEDHPDGTLIRDTVRYKMPFGPLGRVARTLFVKRDTERIFAYRQEAIREALNLPPE